MLPLEQIASARGVFIWFSLKVSCEKFHLKDTKATPDNGYSNSELGVKLEETDFMVKMYFCALEF